MGTTVKDRFLDGRLVIRQLRHGYRAAMDPVLLAAAVLPGSRVLDLGCGTGTALFCYGRRVRDAQLVGLEIDGETADLARINATANGMDARTAIETGDLLSPPDAVAVGSFDQVFANPPHMDPAAGSASPVPDRARSNVEGAAKLKDWIAAMLRLVRPKGGIVLIHRADRLDTILRHLSGKAGEITVIPLWPRDGMPAKRVIVRARKGTRGGTIIHPGLTLHDPGETQHTAVTAAILRDGKALA